MRVALLYWLTILTALSFGELIVTPGTLRQSASSSFPELKNLTHTVQLPARQVDTNRPPNLPYPPVAPADPLWAKAVCLGRKLYRAMLHDPAEAVNYLSPITSAFDGTMEESLENWGWDEVPSPDFDDDNECDFGQDGMYGVSRAFEDLDINPKSAVAGGPNHCFRLQHYDGPTVKKDPRTNEAPDMLEQRYDGPDGREYRSLARIPYSASTPTMEYEYTSSIASPPSPPPAETGSAPLLPPHSRNCARVPDLAWAFWNRMHAHGEDVQHITKFMSLRIVNTDTQKLINLALPFWVPPQGQARVADVQGWPGTTFAVTNDDDEESMALLGSANALAAGFFLAQHKTQIGGNKYISHVTVFRPDMKPLPNMILWVDDAPVHEDDPMDIDGSSGLAGRRVEGVKCKGRVEEGVKRL